MKVTPCIEAGTQQSYTITMLCLIETACRLCLMQDVALSHLRGGVYQVYLECSQVLSPFNC